MKMDKRIEKLPNTDETTKVIIQELVEKKEKLDKTENDYRFHVFLSFGLAIILLYSLFQSLNQLDVVKFSTILLRVHRPVFQLAIWQT